MISITPDNARLQVSCPSFPFVLRYQWDFKKHFIISQFLEALCVARIRFTGVIAKFSLSVMLHIIQ